MGRVPRPLGPPIKGGVVSGDAVVISALFSTASSLKAVLLFGGPSGVGGCFFLLFCLRCVPVSTKNKGRKVVGAELWEEGCAPLLFNCF